MTLDWFAGLFEGEGYISCPKKHPNRWMLGLTSTDLDVLERVVATVGGKIYGPYKNNIPNRKPQWTWYMSKKNKSVPLLESLVPLLCSRRRQRAQEALAAHYEYEATKPKGIGSRGPRKQKKE